MTGNNQIPEQIIKISDQSKQATDENMDADKNKLQKKQLMRKTRQKCGHRGDVILKEFRTKIYIHHGGTPRESQDLCTSYYRRWVLDKSRRITKSLKKNCVRSLRSLGV